MAIEEVFPALLRRIRAGDSDAAEEFLRIYGSHLQRAVRIEMRDQRLRRIFDSTDICQSVLASFFVRMTLGQYELDRPEQLLSLLAAMVRNKIASHARKAPIARRAEWNAVTSAGHEGLLVDSAPGPDREVAARDLLQAVRARLTDEERHLSDLRIKGLTWAQIATELGAHPDSLRIKLTRALGRVTECLGLDPFEEE